MRGSSVYRCNRRLVKSFAYLADGCLHVAENNAAKASARQEFNANPQPMRQVQRSSEVIEIDGWAEDTDLIDDTSGFDPTPDEFDPADGDEYYLEDEF